LTDCENLTGYSQTLSELDESYTKVSRNYLYGQELLTQRTPGEGLDYLDPENPANDQLAFFHQDHLGSSRLLTDSDGSAISNSAFNYSPYGDLLSGSSSLTSYHFTGQYLDTALNLQYHRARWLSTSLGTWLSGDPVFDFPGNFGNLYAYVGRNSINFIDPIGESTLANTLAVAAVVTILLAVAIPNIRLAKKRAWVADVTAAQKASIASMDGKDAAVQHAVTMIRTYKHQSSPYYDIIAEKLYTDIPIALMTINPVYDGLTAFSGGQTHSIAAIQINDHPDAYIWPKDGTYSDLGIDNRIVIWNKWYAAIKLVLTIYHEGHHAIYEVAKHSSKKEHAIIYPLQEEYALQVLSNNPVEKIKKFRELFKLADLEKLVWPPTHNSPEEVYIKIVKEVNDNIQSKWKGAP
jgi:RHS repeat-associated protein